MESSTDFEIWTEEGTVILGTDGMAELIRSSGNALRFYRGRLH